jgi:hypothetical protein
LFIYTKREKMADKGSNNWLWWSIGGIATLGLGLGIYYYIKAQEEEQQKKNEESSTPPISSGGGNVAPATNPTPAPQPTNEVLLPKATPFTSIEQGNAFRQWVNAKDPAFAKKIELAPFSSSTNSFNNNFIQLAWSKYGDAYYTENASNLGFAMRTATGATQINGGVIWKSSDAIPRGEVTMYTDGKITANAINSQGAQTKFIQGGWYRSGSTYKLMIGGAEYSSGLLGLRNDFWNILKKAGIFNDSTNTYSAFVNADGRGASVFGVNGGEGGISQDMML